MANYLLLKWGTVKGWNFEDEKSDVFKLLKKYLKDSPMSCMMDRPTEKRKKLLCQIIDEFDGEIRNDWTGKKMTKEKAKKYVMDYD